LCRFVIDIHAPDVALLPPSLEPVKHMLVLTPETLERAYDYLRSTKPFSSWNLPEPEDVTFKVIRDRSVHGWHRFQRLPGRKIKHTVAISRNTVGHTLTLFTSLAHEKCHMYEAEMGLTPGHGPVFQKLSAQVCKFHGFDPKLF